MRSTRHLNSNLNRKHPPGPPDSEPELLQRAAAIAGQTLGQVAATAGLVVPDNQRRHKGWTGQLAEQVLGASASNLAEPDFQQIGIELKTIPMAQPGIPKESTYICTVNLTDTIGISWEQSVVQRKLARVLWLPVESSVDIPLRQRRFGNALIWSPSGEQEAILRNDWEEIMELVCRGELDQLTASIGQYLQVRPKAANARALGRSFGSDGLSTSTLPRGFYLRSAFTRTLFRDGST